MTFSWALITGATSGIGKALSSLLAEQHINLILTGRNEQQLEQLRHQFEAHIQVKTLAIDLNEKSQRAQLVQLIQQLAPDLVINNAGFGFYGEALSYPTEQQLNILEVNGLAVLELTLEAARALIAQNKKGVILNVSSVAAFQVFPYLAVYAASKTFVNQLSLALDEEMRSYGVRVLVACPGKVNTDFQKRAGGETDVKAEPGVMSADYVAQAIWKQIQEQKPLNIINWKYKIMTYLSYLMPRRAVSYSIKEIIRKRIQPRKILK